MTKLLISAIPEVLNDLWYLYHVALVGVIVVSLLLMKLLKKETKLKKARKNANNALQIFKKAAQAKNMANIKIKSLTALNLLKTAEFYLEGHIADTDEYALKDAKEKLTSLIAKITEDLKESTLQFATKGIAKYIVEIESIISEVI